MTGREAALRALADCDAPGRDEALADFHRRYRDKPAVLDKWFSIQALSAREDVIDLVPRLLAHADFSWSRPSRLGALVGAFAFNQHALHHVSGRGYRFLADMALAIDRRDPRAAARLAAPLARWRRFEPGRAARMKAQLERLGEAPEASASLRDLAAAALA
jgi:aminopeptidase N